MLVVLYHFFHDHVRDVPVLGRAVLHGYVAVDLFFVLSGFIVAATYAPRLARGLDGPGTRAFLQARLARVAPLYLATVLAATALRLLGAAGTRPPPFGRVVANLLGVQAWGLSMSIVGPSWSVSTEVAAYLIFPGLVALAVAPRGERRALALLAGAAAVVVLLTLRPDAALNQGHRSGPLDIYGRNTVYPLLRCLAEFTVGVVAYRLGRGHGALLARVRLADAAGLAAGLLLLVPALDALLVAVFALLVAALYADATAPSGPASLASRLLGSPLCHGLGLVSYSLYLGHGLIDDFARAPLRALVASVRPDEADLGAAGLMVPLALLLAAATFNGIEKPARAWLRRRAGLGAGPALAREPAAP